MNNVAMNWSKCGNNFQSYNTKKQSIYKMLIRADVFPLKFVPIYRNSSKLADVSILNAYWL